MRLKNWTIMALCLIASLSLSGCGSQSETAFPGGEMPGTSVRTAKVEKRDMPVTLETVGHLSASAQVEITASVEGELLKNYFAEGSPVKKGDLLFEIHSGKYQALVDRTQSALERYETELAHAKKKLERHSSLVEKDFVTQSRFDDLKKEASVFESLIKTEKANLALAQLDLDHCSVRAPIEGLLGKQKVDVGNRLQPGAILTTLVQGAPIHVDFQISEKHLSVLKQTQLHSGELTITGFVDGEPIAQGVLTFIHPVISKTSGTVALRGRFLNEKSLLHPGQFVTVRINLENIKDSLIVPKSAVQISEDGAYVYIVNEDSTVRYALVQKGHSNEDFVVITGDIQENDKVITEGHLHLYPGAKVTEVHDVDEDTQK